MFYLRLTLSISNSNLFFKCIAYQSNGLSLWKFKNNINKQLLNNIKKTEMNDKRPETSFATRNQTC